MNDPQEKNTQNPYHIYYDNYLDTNACTECTGLMNHGIGSREKIMELFTQLNKKQGE